MPCISDKTHETNKLLAHDRVIDERKKQRSSLAWRAAVLGTSPSSSCLITYNDRCRDPIAAFALAHELRNEVEKGSGGVKK
jgi:hypothetical protein